MKSRSLLASFATLIAFTAAPVMAADMRMPVKAPPPVVAPVYNWTGFYIGAHVGGAWGDKDWSDPFGDFFGTPGASLGSHDVSGVIAGGQIGYNWQAPGSNWVFGIEGQGSWANLKGDHIVGGDELFRTKVRWLATVAGRLGYAWDRVLLYAKGGAAFAGDKFTHIDIDDNIPFSKDKTRTGWMVGGGLELALAGNWTVKGEYNYMDFGNKQVTILIDGFSTRLDIDQQIHVVKFGVNYRFGGWAAPVAARY